MFSAAGVHKVGSPWLSTIRCFVPMSILFGPWWPQSYSSPSINWQFHTMCTASENQRKSIIDCRRFGEISSNILRKENIQLNLPDIETSQPTEQKHSLIVSICENVDSILPWNMIFLWFQISDIASYEGGFLNYWMVRCYNLIALHALKFKWPHVLRRYNGSI